MWSIRPSSDSLYEKYTNNLTLNSQRTFKKLSTECDLWDDIIRSQDDDLLSENSKNECSLIVWR